MLARREISVEMLEAAEGFLDHRHLLDGHIKAALRAMDGVGSDPDRDAASASAEWRVVDGLRKAAAILRGSTRSSIDKGEAPESLRVLIDEELDQVATLRSVELSLEELVLSDRESTAEWLVRKCNAEVGNALRFSLRQVLSNALGHGLQDGSYSHTRPSGWRADLALTVGSTHVGGRDSVVLGIQNAAWAEQTDDDFVSRVFREPVESRPGRIGLGAFLAGEALRRVGGAATFRIDQTLNEASVIVVAELAIPVQEMKRA